ncbi:MAG: hypothetical protein PUD20_03345 [bacterium]|nr:hypothetical protein [bacterium]
MLRRLNEALPGLLLGIIGYGLLFQLTGVWFVDDKLLYSVGLWIGIACSVFMAVHMAISIEDAVSIGTENGAKRKVIASALIRYVVVLIALVAMLYFQVGMLLPAVLGVLSLKLSAYTQPVFYRLFAKNKHNEEESETEPTPIVEKNE